MGCREQLAGPPEGEHLFQAGEQARQGGEDEGVQRRNHPGAGGLVIGLGAQAGGDAGDVLGQGLR